MRRLVITIVLSCCFLLSTGAGDPANCGHRIGGGIHYLRTLGDIKDIPEWDPNAVGFMISYQFTTSLIKIEGDLEWIPDYGGTEKTMFQPQGWLILGGFIYGAIGIGWNYFDGEWLDDPFYGLRLGADLSFGGIGLDCFATYRFLNTRMLKDIDEEDVDSITFGVMVRFGS